MTRPDFAVAEPCTSRRYRPLMCCCVCVCDILAVVEGVLFDMHSAFSKVRVVAGVSDDDDVPLLTSAWSGQPPSTEPPRDVAALHDLRAVRRAKWESALQNSNAELDKSISSVREPQASPGQRALGFLNLARHAVSKGLNSVAFHTSESIDSAASALHTASLKRYFPELAAAGAVCVDTFHVTVLHGTALVPGTLYITNTHLAFHNGGRICSAFRWEAVVALVQCVPLDTYDISAPVFLLPKPGLNVRAGAIQVYLVDQRLISIVDVSLSTSDRVSQIANASVSEKIASSMAYASLFDAWTQCKERTQTNKK